MSGVTQLYGHVVTVIGEEKYPSCTLFFYGADKPEGKILRPITERLLPGSACTGFQVFFYFVAMYCSTHPQPLLQSLQLRPIWFPSFAQAHTASLHIVFFSSFAFFWPFHPRSSNTLCTVTFLNNNKTVSSISTEICKCIILPLQMIM